ncbi:hypothetical protein DVH26_35810 [Paenibacillus sp. H1-7]|uniref:hypothetical protein n=1 Tax=Paenibacillus sp. H1-7 TaxID=2282849 RepID=UPI001EF7EB99|nr:hypothetical protein [Paenibacillus sp. H1-7]ULL19320.1 hypothetical protein DVH26_35810 [Paenibacillus sp. H1-7]
MAELDNEQRARIHKALEYIENHLDQTLTLEHLAKMVYVFSVAFSQAVYRNARGDARRLCDWGSY